MPNFSDFLIETRNYLIKNTVVHYILSVILLLLLSIMVYFDFKRASFVVIVVLLLLLNIFFLGLRTKESEQLDDYILLQTLKGKK